MLQTEMPLAMTSAQPVIDLNVALAFAALAFAIEVIKLKTCIAA